MRIMLVEDSKTMRSIQKNVLAKLGYRQVAEACDGQDALSKVDAFNPDLLLVDWNMPHMDGMAFVKAYRGRGKNTPIIMVTTDAEKTRVIQAIQAGVNSYVVKPFTPEALSQRVRETMARTAA